MSRLRIVYAVLCFTAISIFSVYLRGSEDQTVYRLRIEQAEQKWLRQELQRKQLQLEGLLNPIKISEGLNEPEL